jgi:hypothetical protein
MLVVDGLVLQGYGGPLPESYMAKQLSLAQRVVQRMREFGMTPVYPAFAGFVPRALAELHPEAALTPASNWCHFPASYCCPLLLDPADPLFAAIGAAYIRTLRAHLGWDSASFYIADTFNEMKPASSSPEYLSGVSASVFAGMTAADPHATWVMQAWLFFSDARFWQPAQIQVRCALWSSCHDVFAGSCQPILTAATAAFCDGSAATCGVFSHVMDWEVLWCCFMRVRTASSASLQRTPAGAVSMATCQSVGFCLAHAGIAGGRAEGSYAAAGPVCRGTPHLVAHQCPVWAPFHLVHAAQFWWQLGDVRRTSISG